MDGKELNGPSSRTGGVMLDLERMESKEYLLRVSAAHLGAAGLEESAGTSTVFVRSDDQKEKLLELIGSMNGVE